MNRRWAALCAAVVFLGLAFGAAAQSAVPALKKAQQDLKNPPPPQPGDPPDSEQQQRLINRLNELKLIREMQLEVNDRARERSRHV